MSVIKVRVAQKEGVTTLPKGTYDLEIIDAKETAAKSSGNMQVALDLCVRSGDYANQTFKAWFVVTEKAAWRLQNLLDSCDPNQEIHTNVPTDEKDSEGNEINDIELGDVAMLVGRTLVAECAPDEDNKGRAFTSIGNMFADESATPQAPPVKAQVKAQADASVDDAPIPPVQETAPVAAPPARKPAPRRASRQRA